MINVARLALRDGNVETAKFALDRVRHLVPRVQQPELRQRFALFDGDVHDLRGEAEQAEADYRRAIELEPRDPQAHMRLALWLAKQRQIEPARAEAQRALALFAPEERDAQAAQFRRILAEPDPPAPGARQPFP